MNKGVLVSVDFDEPEQGKMVLHIATDAGGVSAGDVFWCFDSPEIRSGEELKQADAENKSRIHRLRTAITLAECQYLGCGGRLAPDEIVSNMRKILQEALSI
jgi:hypothetical protein